MDPFRAAILGLVQGLTEFLPISSSGHLVLVPWVLGWPDHGLAFDAALHLGTIAALLVYFWRDWVGIVRAFIVGLTHRKEPKPFQYHLGWMIIVGSIPAGVVGLLAGDTIEESLRHPPSIAWLLIIFALVLLVAERLSSRKRKLEDLGFRDAVIVGLAQALALAPGVSRSGVTLTAGLFLGLERAAAARFSFLLSTPIAMAAGLWQLIKLLRAGPDAESVLVLGIGVAVAAISGLAAISLLLRFLQRNPTDVFVWYRVCVGVCVLLVSLVA